MPQNESAIEQMNLGFNEPEDRLLLKVGLADKTEVAVWITRRMCKSIWSSLQMAGNALLPTAHQFEASAIATPEDKKQAVESFVRESENQKKLEHLDFKTEYIAGRQTLSEAPMLAVQCMVVTVGDLPPQLELQCTHGQSVKLTLTNELVHAVTSMMQLAIREAGWDLLMTADNTQVSITPSKPMLH